MKKYLLFIGLVCMLTACDSFQEFNREVEVQIPSESRDVQVAILNWLECEECLGNERGIVLQLGDSAVLPYLINSFEKGPSPARVRRMSEGLRNSYRNLREFSPDLPQDQVQGEPIFIEENLSNYKARYQFRAALAVDDFVRANPNSEFGTIVRDSVRNTLDLAQEFAYDTVVRRDVRERLLEIFNR